MASDHRSDTDTETRFVLDMKTTKMLVTSLNSHSSDEAAYTLQGQ